MNAKTGAEAFRTFALDPPYAVRTLRTELVSLKADAIMQLAEGYAIDWPDYKQRVGNIQGLSAGIALCERMEKEEKR